MKILVPLVWSVSAVFLLQACGSNSKKTPAPEPTVISEKIVEPIAVHTIQPGDIAKYVSDFNIQQKAMNFQFEGVSYDISLVDFDMNENVIYAKFDKGFIIIGFDFDKNKGIKTLRVIESNLADIGDAFAAPDRILNGTSITIESDSDDNTIYSGSVMDTTTQGIFSVRLVINESLISGGSSVIKVDGTNATVNGDLGTSTYVQIQNLINNNPEVTTLLLQKISGSVNDAINMHTGRLVRNAQITTKVEATSDINSGGVDLYAAGFKRVYTDGAKVGVHSWCCVDGKAANELPRDHSAHGAQLTFVREMLGAELGPEFYFFTLEASPFSSVHVMTKAELEKYLISL